jgi:hypothetical protein
MNDWAWADGDTIAMVATAAAINFERMGWFLPLIAQESERLNAPGQPMPWVKKNACDV